MACASGIAAPSRGNQSAVQARLQRLMTTSSRVTQKDVAREAGVGRSTVTYALKNSPKIPRETRERILQIAEKLGYVPDPMLASLASYRAKKRPHSFCGTLVWLAYSAEPINNEWRLSPHYLRYFQGAEKRALTHGYKLEEFAFNRTELTPQRVAGILKTRGVVGVLLGPLRHSDMEVDFPWEEFSTVTFGYTLRRPRLHTVASAHFQNVRRAMQRMKGLGYRRIGLMVERETDVRCQCAVSGGYLAEQMAETHDPSACMPAFLDYSFDDAFSPEVNRRLCDYLRQHQADALLTSNYLIMDQVRRKRFPLPRGVGLAGLSLPAPDPEFSGIVEDSERIGEVAVDWLVGMIQRGERGVPAAPIRSHVEGIWTDGSSLKRRPTAARGRAG